MSIAAAPTASPQILELDRSADPRWDAYVREHPGAGVYHLSAWGRILGGAYGYKPRYLALEDAGGALRGVLPMMETRGIVTGRRLRSLPSVPPAGPVADDDEGVAALVREACAIAERDSAKVWTLHARAGGLEEVEPRLAPIPKAPTWIVPLPSDPDELRAAWRKGSKNLHRSINKSQKSGLTVREGHSPADLRAFYRFYLETMRRHHALPRAYRQISLAQRLLPAGVFRQFVVEHQGAPVAGGLFHHLGDTVDLLYNASDESHLDLRPNHALYWHVIQWAIEQGCSRFDFGFAWGESPLARFKAQWGAELVPEHRYDYRVGAGVERADALRAAGDRLDTDAHRTDLVARLWARSPLPLTRAAGAAAYRFL